jgi:hypothetical protein
VLSIVFLETIDNNFLDAPSKTTIISLISKSTHETTSAIPDLVSPDPTRTRVEKTVVEKTVVGTLALLAAISAVIGAFTSIVSVNSEWVTHLYKLLVSYADLWVLLFGVVVVTGSVYTIILSVARRPTKNRTTTS